MKHTLLVALAVLLTAINTTAQVLYNETARYYLPTSQTFTQGQIDSFNSIAGYQNDIVNGQALSYPDLQPILLTQSGTNWISATPVAITNAFTTPLMANGLTHTATATAGATNPNVVVDWADVTGVTQYRFRFRQVGGVWNTSTITGSQRTMNSLAYSTTYECQIRVYINATTQGEYSTTYTFTTPSYIALPICEIPTYSVTKTADSIRFNINTQTNAIAYQIQMRQLNSLYWGGTTINTNYRSFSAQNNTAYEFQIRSNCTNSQTTWSAMSNIDTSTDAICTPPTGLTNNGNTFSWTSNQYAKQTQIQTRLVGTTNWGGTTVTGNTRTFPYLWGQHEWRVRSTCYATTNTTWTDWTYGLTNFIPNPNTFEQFETETAYPNPASDVIKFNGAIVVRDLTGRIVAQGENEVDVQTLVDGLYFVNGKKHIIKH